jgi:hypothetical protein
MQPPFDSIHSFINNLPFLGLDKSRAFAYLVRKKDSVDIDCQNVTYVQGQK